MLSLAQYCWVYRIVILNQVMGSPSVFIVSIILYIVTFYLDLLGT